MIDMILNKQDSGPTENYIEFLCCYSVLGQKKHVDIASQAPHDDHT